MAINKDVDFFKDGPWTVSESKVIEAPVYGDSTLPHGIRSAFGEENLSGWSSSFFLNTERHEVFRLEGSLRNREEVRIYEPSRFSVFRRSRENNSLQVVRRCTTALPRGLQAVLDAPEFEVGDPSEKPNKLESTVICQVLRYFWGTSWQLLQVNLPLGNAVAFLLNEVGEIQHPYLHRRRRMADLFADWYIPYPLADFLQELDEPWTNPEECFCGRVAPMPMIESADSDEDWDSEIEEALQKKNAVDVEVLRISPIPGGKLFVKK